jgi:branched-chain amino acid transport system ATP-binding protein
MLSVESLVSGYDGDPILRGVTFTLADRSIVAVLGHNGAGKSSLVRALVGLIPIWEGSVQLDGHDLTHESAAQRVRSGLAVSFQDDAVFPTLNVSVNLGLGAHTRAKNKAWVAQRREQVLEIFPALKRLLAQAAYTLSGGERRMLSIAMALMSDPNLLILDEPSTGLSPAVAEFVFDTLVTIRDKHGKSILLIEQNVQQALHIADHAVVLKVGAVIFEGAPSLLAKDTTELVAMF